MTSIRHIEFWVKDVNKSLDFYKDLFKVLHWERAGNNGFSLEGTKIYFLERKDVGYQSTLGPRHICFEAKDTNMVDAVSMLPKIKDGILHGPGILHKSGSYMVVFKDPDGYILEVAHKE